MFKCDKCGKVTQPGEKQTKKIVQTRTKMYYFEDKYGNKKKKEGHEIVKEINLCEQCAEKESVKNDNSKSR